MNFAYPLALLLLLLLVPVALLYWLRVGVPRRVVGTGQFWQRALAEEKGRWRWRRWRSKVSLAVQMLIVILLTLAAAGPQIPSPKRIVLILDNSATMRATDVQPTRLDAAKAVALRLIEGLRSCDEMAVVTVGSAPSEIQPLTSNPALLAAAVDSVQATEEPPAIDWAIKLGREIPMPGTLLPPRIVLITDATAKEAVKRAQESGVEVLRVGTAAGNLAITCFTARRSKAEPTKCEVFVEVRNQGDPPAAGAVTLEVDKNLPSPAVRGAGDGNLLPSSAERGAGGDGLSAPFSIAKDAGWQHVFTLDLPKAARLKAKLEPGDAYVFDDTAMLDVPAAPDPWKDEVFAALGRGAISPMSPLSPMIPSSATSPGTDLRVPGDLGSDVSALAVEKPQTPLWIFPAVVAAALVVFEWCLYQRRWTS